MPKPKKNSYSSHHVRTVILLVIIILLVIAGWIWYGTSSNNLMNAPVPVAVNTSTNTAQEMVDTSGLSAISPTDATDATLQNDLSVVGAPVDQLNNINITTDRPDIATNIVNSMINIATSIEVITSKIQNRIASSSLSASAIDAVNADIQDANSEVSDATLQLSSAADGIDTTVSDTALLDITTAQSKLNTALSDIGMATVALGQNQ